MARFGLEPGITQSVFTFLFYCPRNKADFLTYTEELAPYLDTGATLKTSIARKQQTYRSFMEKAREALPDSTLIRGGIRSNTAYQGSELTIRISTHFAYDQAVNDHLIDPDSLLLVVRIKIPALYVFDALSGLIAGDGRALLSDFTRADICPFDLTALYERCDELQTTYCTFLSWEDYASTLKMRCTKTPDGSWRCTPADISNYDKLAMLFFGTSEAYLYLGIQQDTANHLCLGVHGEPRYTSLSSSYCRWTTDLFPVPVYVVIQLRGTCPRWEKANLPDGLLEFPLLTAEEQRSIANDESDIGDGVQLTKQLRCRGGATMTPLEG